jgi:hypothetical protein
MFRKIFQLLNMDLSGRSGTREVHDSYFGRIIRFWSKKTPGDYWEAELTPEGTSKPVGITFTGTESGPEEAEVVFCRSILEDLDAAFERCRVAFTPTYEHWAHTQLPTNWRGAFELDGFEIPLHGDATNDWHICYFAPAAGHHFTAYFKNGRVQDVAVDG